MKRQLVIAIAAHPAAIAMLAPAPARAQEVAVAERPYLLQSVPAPSRAFELTVGTGYTQGFGTLESGLGVPRVAKAGIGVDASVGYRIEPSYSVSFGAQYQELTAVRDDAARGFAVSLALQYHIVPSARLDPWVEIGSGYRMLWLLPFGPGPTTFYNGPQLVRLRAGVDLRLSRAVAVSPMIGADATMFVYRDAETISAIPTPTISVFVYAGLLGRFDIGGSHPAQLTLAP